MVVAYQVRQRVSDYVTPILERQPEREMLNIPPVQIFCLVEAVSRMVHIA
jgi:hypothetical protein